MQQNKKKTASFRAPFPCCCLHSYKPNSVPKRPAGRFGDNHLSGSVVADTLERFKPTEVGIRSCTRVRILPFHSPCFHEDYSLRNPSPFGRGVSARTSRITPDGRYPLRVMGRSLLRVRTFLCMGKPVQRLSECKQMHDITKYRVCTGYY